MIDPASSRRLSTLLTMATEEQKSVHFRGELGEADSLPCSKQIPKDRAALWHTLTLMIIDSDSSHGGGSAGTFIIAKLMRIEKCEGDAI